LKIEEQTSFSSSSLLQGLPPLWAVVVELVCGLASAVQKMKPLFPTRDVEH